jgi:hypothetical protein
MLVAACDPLSDPVSPAAPADAGGAARELAALTVAPWGPMTHYSRDRFPHWISQGDGCDTRDVVLKRQGSGVVATATCTVTSGSWFSEYDGTTVTDAHDIDIDHMVPLANAWRTGASAWTDEQREQFANDLARPQLFAVTAKANRSKGDQDPSQWRPPRRAFWCTYAQDWVAVKSYWRLSVTTAEKAALEEMLATC